MEERARNTRVCILLYAHNSGAHYIALRWNGAQYDVYNNDDIVYALTIDGFLKRVGGTFVTIWFIN